MKNTMTKLAGIALFSTSMLLANNVVAHETIEKESPSVKKVDNNEKDVVINTMEEKWIFSKDKRMLSEKEARFISHSTNFHQLVKPEYFQVNLDGETTRTTIPEVISVSGKFETVIEQPMMLKVKDGVSVVVQKVLYNEETGISAFKFLLEKQEVQKTNNFSYNIEEKIKVPTQDEIMKERGYERYEPTTMIEKFFLGDYKKVYINGDGNYIIHR